MVLALTLFRLTIPALFHLTEAADSQIEPFRFGDVMGVGLWEGLIEAGISRA